jgi:exosortase A
MSTGASVSGTVPGHADSGWRVALPALAGVWVLLLYQFRDAGLGMVSIWERSGTFTHCFLIPPIVAWLVWRKRGELALMAPTPGWLGLLLLAVPALAWLTGELATIDAFTHFGLVGMLVASVPVILGFAVASRIAFPLAFLFLAVPFGEFVMPTMMEWTANFTVMAIDASGIPVHREGLQFVIPSGNWSVVEACSGVRYLIASFTVGTLFAYLNYRSALRRSLFMLVSLLVPVVANWLRAYMIVMLGHLSSNKLAVGVDHLIYGWVFFGVVIMTMFAIGARWSQNEAVPEPVAPASAKGESGTAMPAVATLGAAIAVLLIATAGPWALERITQRESTAPVAIAPLGEIRGWHASAYAATRWRPAFETPAAEARTSFARDGAVVDLRIGYYRHQTNGRKMVGSESVLVKSEDPAWAKVGGGSRDAFFGNRQVRVEVASLRGLPAARIYAEERLRVWTLYWIDGRLTSSPQVAKALTAWSRLTGRGDDSAVILIVGNAAQGGSDASLEAFLAAAGDAIDASLRQTGSAR